MAPCPNGLNMAPCPNALTNTHSTNPSTHSQKKKGVAVSKKKSVEYINEALSAGIKDFGENYAQELNEKKQALFSSGIIWHFIGPLQSNKVKVIANCATWIPYDLSASPSKILCIKIIELFHSLIDILWHDKFSRLSLRAVSSW